MAGRAGWRAPASASRRMFATARASASGRPLASSVLGDALRWARAYGARTLSSDLQPKDDPARVPGSVALPGDEQGRVKRTFGSTRELGRIAYRDPEHISERLTLHATQNLAEQSREWAEQALRENPDSSPTDLADDLR